MTRCTAAIAMPPLRDDPRLPDERVVFQCELLDGHADLNQLDNAYSARHMVDPAPILVRCQGAAVPHLEVQLPTGQWWPADLGRFDEPPAHGQAVAAAAWVERLWVPKVDYDDIQFGSPQRVRSIYERSRCRVELVWSKRPKHWNDA